MDGGDANAGQVTCERIAQWRRDENTKVRSKSSIPENIMIDYLCPDLRFRRSYEA